MPNYILKVKFEESIDVNDIIIQAKDNNEFSINDWRDGEIIKINKITKRNGRIKSSRKTDSHDKRDY